MQTILESFSPPLPAPTLARMVGAAGAPADRAELSDLLINELAHGVVMVDTQCWIGRANAAAMRELQGQTVLLNQRGRLAARLPADQELLEVALQNAARGQRSLVELTCGNGAFSVAVLPLVRQQRADNLCDHIALVFSRARLHDSSIFAAFARNHRLTPTEQLVLVCLCRCLTTPEIAIEMEIAVSTVRSHVRSLCAKTASSGVRQLVGRLAMLPPLASPVAPLPSHFGVPQHGPAINPHAKVAHAANVSEVANAGTAPPHVQNEFAVPNSLFTNMH